MTVKELIDLLSTYPDDHVIITDSGPDSWDERYTSVADPFLYECGSMKGALTISMREGDTLYCHDMCASSFDDYHFEMGNFEKHGLEFVPSLFFDSKKDVKKFEKWYKKEKKKNDK